VTPLAFEFGSRIVHAGRLGAINGAVYGLLGLGDRAALQEQPHLQLRAGASSARSPRSGPSPGSPASGFIPEMNYVFAAILGVSLAVVVALLTERLVVRPLFSQPKVTLVVATAGVA
jgi:hypothetical protein